MAVITLPPLYLRVRRFDIDVPGQINRSDWSGGGQRLGLPGADTWYGKAAFLNTGREREKRLLRAFLVSLKGIQNSFHMPVASGQHAGPNPTVASVQGENTVTLSSAANLTSGMFATFTTGAKKRLVVVNATNVASFSNRISFEPMLRSDPSVGSTVEIMNPYCDVSLSNARNGWDEDEGVMSLEFDVEEA